ncbi:MAG: lipoate--protein ligase family protein [Mariniblastus sp.]|nr:lipoate--protein ligase family protein [Mariniblastus sp.]
MQLLELTLDGSLANIALDEALLEAAENGSVDQELLRLWQPTEPMVVVGRSSSVSDEVNLDYCQKNKIPVVRRCSGGATIVAAKGCLMYAVLLSYQQRPELRMLEQAHQFVMSRLSEAAGSLGVVLKLQGICDLTLADRKVSGNALRCKKNWMIYHGTLLCEMDLDLISNCLGQPRRQPAYREGRSHAEFVGQLPVSTEALSTALVESWQAHQRTSLWPRERTAELVAEKYSAYDWNHKVV